MGSLSPRIPSNLSVACISFAGRHYAEDVYNHRAIFYEDKSGRIAAEPMPSLNSNVSTQQSFDMDSAVMQNKPAMLDEMREEESNDGHCELGEDDNNTRNDQLGGVDTESVGDARSGGVKQGHVEKRSGH